MTDVKPSYLDFIKGVWSSGNGPGQVDPEAISSDESLSDCEEIEVCRIVNEDSSHRLDGNHIVPWDMGEINKVLSGLLNSTFGDAKANDVAEIIHNQDLDEIDDLFELLGGLDGPSEVKRALILYSSWATDNSSLINYLIGKGADPNTADKDGRSCLHLGCTAGHSRTVDALLKYGADGNAFDKNATATPLFCAAVFSSKSHGTCIDYLLEAGADINAGLRERGDSALSCAVRANAVDQVKRLLDRGANPNSVQMFSETPLHIASSMGFDKCVRILVKKGASLEVMMGTTMKMTALHLAAQNGNVECLRILLNGGAYVDAKNGRGQSALHLASLGQCAETVQCLLHAGANPNAEDFDLRTPLHCAIAKGSRSYECAKLLLNVGANVNRQDLFGYSPLHIAVLNEYSFCTNMLMAYGADLTAKTNGGTSALAMIVRKIPNVLPKFEDMLDHAITLVEHDINDVDCVLKLNFKVLIPNRYRGESTMFINFIEIGLFHLLKHPLCESFLYIKWLKVRKFFLFGLMFHLLFTMLHTTFVLLVYCSQCKIKDNCKYPDGQTNFSAMDPLPKWHSRNGDCFQDPFEEQCYIGWITIFVWVLLLTSTLILMVKETFQFIHSQRQYFMDWQNWVQLGIIIDVLLISFHRDPSPALEGYASLIDRWQHHAAAVGIFMVWGELMLTIGRLPTFGVYVQMFTTVAKNFSKLLAAYFCLLVAFALSFCVLFPNYQSFNVDIPAAVVKTLVMMAGEIEYETFIYKNGQALFNFTGHLMILIFIVLVSIILMNLLVGLAVSDIQGLQKSAGLDRLVRQTELIYHIESMLFSRLLRFLPVRFLAALYQQTLVVPHGFRWTLTLRPNDLREDRLPKEIMDSIHRLVSMRHKPRKRRPFSRYANKKRMNSMRENPSSHDSKLIQEKLEVVNDLRSHMRSMTSDNRYIMMNQDTLNSNMAKMTQMMSLMSNSLDRITPSRSPIKEHGKAETETTKEVFDKTENEPLIQAEEEESDDEEPKDTFRRGSVFELRSSKLRRTNHMRRKESKALLEAVRKKSSSTKPPFITETDAKE